jgi:hypothetical protein
MPQEEVLLQGPSIVRSRKGGQGKSGKLWFNLCDVKDESTNYLFGVVKRLLQK